MRTRKKIVDDLNDTLDEDQETQEHQFRVSLMETLLDIRDLLSKK